MRFQLVAKVHQLPIKLRHFVGHFRYGFGRPDTGDHVLTLGVNEVLAIHFIFPSARIAGKADAGRTIVAHIAEDHRDHVDRRAVGHLGRDVELAPVIDRPLAHP